jgi:hypothetical protein
MSGADLERLEDTITDMLVDLGLPPEPHGDKLYAFSFADVVLMVSLFDAADQSWVRIATPILEGIRPNLELVTRVLRLNTEVLLGSFLIFEDNTLGFSITLPGLGLQAETFRLAMEQAASIGSRCGEELAAIAGGRLSSGHKA